MKKIVVDGETYTPDCQAEVLEVILMRYFGLDDCFGTKVSLTESELMALKSWLMERAEKEMVPGNYYCFKAECCR